MISAENWSRDRKLTRPLGLLGGLSLLLGACAPSGESPAAEDDELASQRSALITRVSGASIASPNIDKTKSYLSQRGISTLDTLGALPGALGSLARRVDGILGAKSADGRFSVSEILRMEQPAYIRTLFPDEKAALPRLWALLETTPADPTRVSVAGLPALAVVDISTPATVPIKPAHLAVGSLPALLLTPARRLEMIVDSDGDIETITEADLDDPLGDPGPWTAEEIEAFKQIKQLFIARAGTRLNYALQVPVPAQHSSSVATLGVVKLVLDQGVRYEESRSALTSYLSPSPGVRKYLQAQRSAKVRVDLGTASQLLLIDINSETERIVTGDLSWEFSGTVVAEVWSDGTRLGSYRLAMPTVAPESAQLDLDDYVDYQLVAGGKPLVRSAVRARTDTTTSYTNYLAWFTFAETTQPPDSVDYIAYGMLETPRPNLLPGRYEFIIPGLSVGTYKLDIAPSGVIAFTRPGDTALRMSLMTGRRQFFSGTYSDSLQIELDPSTGNLKVGFAGASALFDAPITDANRTG